MKLSSCVFVALSPFAAASAGRPRPAFVGSSTTTRRFGATTSQLALAGGAERAAAAMADDWDELQRMAKVVERTDDESAALDLVEKVLKTALDYTRIKEDVEKEHASTAHEALDRALSLEESLKAIVGEAHDDAEDAMAAVGAYEKEGFPEYREKRRDVTVAEISHRVENYAEERLHEAREAEIHAQEEEDEAVDTLEQLAQKEEELKKTLEELKVFKMAKAKMQQ